MKKGDEKNRKEERKTKSEKREEKNRGERDQNIIIKKNRGTIGE